jgi:hypothetical protein
MTHFNSSGSDTSNDLKRAPRRGAVLNLHWYKNQVANFENPINMFGKDRDDVRAEGMKYLTNDNIGKYLIYRDDNENAQHDENGKYIIKKIICSTKTTPCVIDLVDKDNDGVLNDIDDDDDKNKSKSVKRAFTLTLSRKIPPSIKPNSPPRKRHQSSNKRGGKKTRNTKKRKQKTIKKSRKH